jgi:predicted metal-dependent hydrolase
MLEVPRFVPDRPLPPYSFVPGRFPHPVSDPAGHLHGRAPERPEPLDPARWQQSEAYRWGIDLFNHGYYWEAHEAWEGLWHAAGRRGLLADFLKGLIKLAAAGVKVREGRAAGVVSHARAAADLFRRTAQALGGEEVRYLGLRLGELIEQARAAEGCARGEADAEAGVVVVFGFVLRPEGLAETDLPGGGS